MSQKVIRVPSTLSQYMRLKAKEYKMSETQLSKMIIPGSSGSLIASVRYNQRSLSEKKINKIAKFFDDDPDILTFMAGRIPKKIHDLIIENKDLQFLLIDMLDSSEGRDFPHAR